MPAVEVVFYKEAGENGSVPAKEWMDGLDDDPYDRLLAKIELLAREGHELKRPHCDFLENNIYELRARVGKVNYRLLYFFYGRTVAVLATGCTKEDKVPRREIDLAIRRRTTYMGDPDSHTARL